ncbi:hypothetical protein D3C86_1834350 [compost metagenome]
MCEGSCYVAKMELMLIFTVSKIIMPLVVNLKVAELMIIVMTTKGNMLKKIRKLIGMPLIYACTMPK